MSKSGLKMFGVWCAAVALFAYAPEAADPTQAVIWIRADARVAALLSQLRCELYPASQTDGESALLKTTFDVTAENPKRSELSIPFSFSILKGTTDRLELVITGHAARSPGAPALIEHKSFLYFETDRSLEFTVLLSDACFNRARDCAALERTCAPRDGNRVRAGECVKVTDAVRTSDDDVDTDGRAPRDGTKLKACDLLDDAICDPIEDCGCGDGRHCQLLGDRTTCGVAGQTARNKHCSSNAECSNELSCAAGVCRPACRERSDCTTVIGDEPGAVCVQSEAQAYGTCWQICGELQSEPCTGKQICSPVRIDENSPPTTLCIAVEDPCTRTENGVCDEPTRGTGLCAAHTDPVDCCNLPEPHGDCDWFTQCGCAAGSRCQIYDVNGATTFVGCQPTGDRPLGSTCDTPSQCVTGAGCFGRICKAMCRDDEDCPNGPCMRVSFNGRQSEEAGVCETACDFESGLPCGPGTVCARLPYGSFCYQADFCPDGYLDDGVCQEDSRLCAPGTDPDCAR